MAGKYDAFISYRRENGFLMAQVIHDRLKERGLNCFLDLEELRSGKFDEKILVAIHEAPNFIMILPKNALNRCVNENDWVRREILAAVSEGKTIIPVMYDGFKWPAKWPEKMPEEIKTLETHNGVSGSQEYLPAMLDKIVSYMTDIHPLPQKAKEQEQSKFAKMMGSTEFFLEGLKRYDHISSVDMAFHAGGEWRRKSEKVDILQNLIDKKIILRVLVNSPEAAEIVCSHMKQPLKKYAGFDKCVEDWTELATMFPDNIKVRIAELPLMHRLYIVRGSSPEEGQLNIKYYTYGNYTPDKDFRLCFEAPGPEYELYTKEFDYLWEKSLDVTQL